MKVIIPFKCLLIVSIAIMFAPASFAQTMSDGFIRDNLNRQRYDLDSTAKAIILYEQEKVEVTLTHKYEVVINYTEVIKVLSQAGTSYANVVAKADYIKNVNAVTYNLDGDEVVKMPIKKDAIFKVKTKTGDKEEVRFTLPDVKPGSIIEYSYTVVTPLYPLLPTWTIQNDLPKLSSRYELRASNTLTFEQNIRCYKPFAQYNNEVDAENANADAYVVRNETLTDQYSIVWVKKNISAIHTEPFSNIENYRERLDLQLAGTVSEQSIFTSWKDLNAYLCEHKHFGALLRKNNHYLDGIVDSLTKNENNEIAKATRIFKYMRENFSCSKYAGFFGSQEINETFKNKRGTAADVNLLLVAMLKQVGLEADPVILSIQGELKIQRDYPMLNRFNYTVCNLKIEGSSYFLDASDKFNSFGLLPQYCYNGYARLVNKKGGAEIDISVDSIKERDVILANLEHISDTDIVLNMTEQMDDFKSWELRKEWHQDTSNKNKYLYKQIQSISDKAQLSNILVDNFDNPDTPLVVKYALRMPIEKTEMIYFPSQLIKFYNDNPFKESQRVLPIELPFKVCLQYMFSFPVPVDLSLEDIPKSSAFICEDKAMNFTNVVNYDTAARILFVRASYTANQTLFPTSEYDNIKSFFEKMILESNKMITLKRNKS